MALRDDRLPMAQQENLLALLAHSDEHGRLIFRTIKPSVFEGDYQEIATRCFRFWEQHGQAPKAHTADLFADILEDKDNRRAPLFRRTLISMFQAAEEEGINARYVLEEATRLTQLHQMKLALNKAAEIVADPTPTSVEDAQRALDGIIRAKQIGFQPGMRLTETKRMLEYRAQQLSEFATGIAALDTRHIIPARRKLMTFIAPSGIGKTWFIVNTAKHNLLRRKKVIIYTGELDEEDVTERTWQALFAASQGHEEDEEIRIPILRCNQNGDLIDIEFDYVTPEFEFTSSELEDELGTRINIHGEGFLNNLIVKRFPNSWTPADLEAHLDQLEVMEGFIPDLAELDSPYHFATPSQNHRHVVRKHVEDFRQICTDRNIAGMATHQTNREGMTAQKARGTHLAEDISMFWTSDILMTFSATEFEHDLGLGRIWVEKARKAKDKWEALITQNYSIGQFCLSSMRMQKTYYDIRKDMQGEESEAEYRDEQQSRNSRARNQPAFRDDDE